MTNSLLKVEREQKETILYQDQLLLSLHIFAWDHGNDAPQSWAGVAVDGEKKKEHVLM